MRSWPSTLNRIRTPAYHKQEAAMHVAELALEGHCVYAAAIGAEGCSHGGQGFYAAAVVVRQRPGSPTREEVFRDERLEDGKVWTEPDRALQFAIEVGEAAILAQAWLAEHMMAQQPSNSVSSKRAA